MNCLQFDFALGSAVFVSTAAFESIGALRASRTLPRFFTFLNALVFELPNYSANAELSSLSRWLSEDVRLNHMHSVNREELFPHIRQNLSVVE